MWRFAHVALYKRATMSNLLRLLMRKERPWAICSVHSWQKNNRIDLLFNVNHLFAHKKKSELLQKPMREFPTLVKASFTPCAIHAVPGGIHAQEVAGGHLEGRQCYQVLGRGPAHTIIRLQGSNCINKEIMKLFTPDRDCILYIQFCGSWMSLAAVKIRVKNEGFSASSNSGTNGNK